MSLVIVGPSKWPENMKLLPGQRRSPLENPEQKSQRSTTPYGHARKLSRPFDVLYQDDLKNIKPPKLEGDLNTQYLNMKTPSYIEIENTLRAGALPSTHQTAQAPPPTVTVIEEKGTRRSSSLRSRLENLRRRHSKRNWMARRRDLYPDGEKSNSPQLSIDTKKVSKIDFIFPIRRKTSFKYSPVQNSKRLRFKSQADVDNYFALDNVAAAVKSLLPQTMNTFQFEGVKRIEPILKIVPHFFGTSRPFDVATSRGPLNQVPLVAHNSTFNTVSSPSHPDSLFQSQRKLYLASLYNKYREIALSARVQFPSTIEVLLPFESEQVFDEEREVMNRNLLFEVLLRRTLAAKIDFRLKQNIRLIEATTPEAKSSSSSSHLSSSSLPKSPMSSHGRLPQQKRSDDESSTSGDSESHRPRGAANRESPALSDLLPSPQITASSTQNFHFSVPEISANDEVTESLGDVFKEPPPKANSASLNLASANTTLEAYANTPHTTLTSPMNAETSLTNSSNEGETKVCEINESSEMSQKQADSSLNIGTADLSLLKPHNYSSDSLSSSSTVSGNNCFEIYHCEFDEDKRDSNSQQEDKEKSEDLSIPVHKHDFAGDSSHQYGPIPDDSDILLATPDVSGTYFYPKFMRLFAPDADSKSKLPSEAAVLQRQQSMRDSRPTKQSKDATLSDTPRSTSSSFERKTIP